MKGQARAVALSEEKPAATATKRAKRRVAPAKSPEKKRTGRPLGASTLLTPQMTESICKMLEIAVPEKYAAEANGIHEDTLTTWKRQGQEGIEPYATFFRAVTRARAKAVANMHVRALGGGKGSSGALWFLERRWWREYAQHQRVEITPPDPVLAMDDDDLDEEIAEQRQRVEEYLRIRDRRGKPVK